MAKKKIAFDFDAELGERETQNQSVEAVNLNQETEKPEQQNVERVKRVTMALSIAVPDKEKLQRYALKHAMTSAGVIHQLIATLED